MTPASSAYALRMGPTVPSSSAFIDDVLAVLDGLERDGGGELDGAGDFEIASIPPASQTANASEVIAYLPAVAAASTPRAVSTSDAPQTRLPARRARRRSSVRFAIATSSHAGHAVDDLVGDAAGHEAGADHRDLDGSPRGLRVSRALSTMITATPPRPSPTAATPCPWPRSPSAASARSMPRPGRRSRIPRSQPGVYISPTWYDTSAMSVEGLVPVGELRRDVERLAVVIGQLDPECWT